MPTILCANPICGQAFYVHHFRIATAKYCSPICYRTYQATCAAERFWSYVYKTDFCWLWIGKSVVNGYGYVSYQGKPQLAHRVSYMLTHGSIPDGLNILHSCDTPRCVFPGHLFLGTQAENLLDARKKGRLVPTNPRVSMQGEKNPHARLTTDDVLYIRSLKGIQTAKEVAAYFHYTPSGIRQIWNGKSWKYLL